MYFKYYWKPSYEGSYRGCPEPVAKVFSALINTADPQSAIPKDRLGAMERSEFWEIAIFGDIAILASIGVLPSLFFHLLEVARRPRRQRSTS